MTGRTKHIHSPIHRSLPIDLDWLAVGDLLGIWYHESRSFGCSFVESRLQIWLGFLLNFAGIWYHCTTLDMYEWANGVESGLWEQRQRETETDAERGKR
jgi:hypothetical protein